MKIAVQGCCHGELDAIYATVAQLEMENNFKVDVLLLCGDFQAVRNFSDLQAMAVPPKYQELKTFYKYYNREKTAPVLTVVIGGNHEASNYMQELSYGGWLATNIYYLGYAGVVTIGGVRFGGISGIYKGHDYNKGHYERPPYTEGSKRSAYHIRNLEVFRLKQISRPIDIFMSHDWPKGIYHHGDSALLMKKKPFFRKEIEENSLGCQPLTELLTHIKPAYWFAAHLHVKFAAHVLHQSDDSGVQRSTRFLALDKCLPRRHFLQVLDVPHVDSEGFKIRLDPEWLTILRSTNHLLKVTPTNTFMPGPGCRERFDFKVEDQEIKETVDIFGGDLTLPANFVQTAPPLVGIPDRSRAGCAPNTVMVNPQTSLLCTMLDLTDPNAEFLGKTSEQILDESYKDDGVEEIEDDNDEMPSYIDSSMDISSSSSVSNVSELDISNIQHTSSNSRSSGVAPNVSPQFDVKVADDDEEFMSILSAQKQKGFDTSYTQKSDTSSTQKSDTPSAQKSETPSTQKSDTPSAQKSDTPSAQKSYTHSAKKSDVTSAQSSISKLHENEINTHIVPSMSHDISVRATVSPVGSSSPGDTDCGELQAILLAQKSANLSNHGGVSDGTVGLSESSSTPFYTSPASEKPSSLNKNATSFGMSLLHLDSSGSNSEASISSVSSPSLDAVRQSKRSSSEFGSPSVTSTPIGCSKVMANVDNLSSVKKLKRRNVSMYIESE